MPLTSASVLAWLDATVGGRARPARCVVGYSGGRDSTVLLSVMAELADTAGFALLAAHVNHGLHPDADAWQAHCAQQAARLGVSFQAVRVEVAQSGASGPEGNARRARYRALAGLLGEGDCVLTAHHRDDQAETVLLNLMRGSGVTGVRGIAACRPLGRGLLLRPLLAFSAADISAYAQRNQLAWVEDASNAETAFDRNFLRHEVLPVLTSRWPAASRQLARSAELAVEAAALLDELAELDRAGCGETAWLSGPQLLALAPAHCRNLIRYACRQLGLSVPPASVLAAIMDDLLPARPDASPLVSWDGAEARRYRDRLYLLPDSAAALPAPGGKLLPGAPLPLGGGLGRLCLARHAGGGIAPQLAEAGLQVRFRHGGESLRPVGRGATRSLKKLLQEAGIVPWMRERLPLLYAGESLVAVADLWIAEANFSSDGYAVTWDDKPAVQ